MFIARQSAMTSRSLGATWRTYGAPAQLYFQCYKHRAPTEHKPMIWNTCDAVVFVDGARSRAPQTP